MTVDGHGYVLVLNENLKSLGDYAFSGDALNVVNFDKCKQLQSVGDSCFYNNLIQSFNFPDTITDFGKYNCALNWSLEYVHLPKGLTEIPDGTFCYSNIYVSDYVDSHDMYRGNPTVFEFPDTITKIGDYAFADTCLYGQTKIASEGETEHYETLMDLEHLLKTYLPNVKVIDKKAFSGDAWTKSAVSTTDLKRIMYLGSIGQYNNLDKLGSIDSMSQIDHRPAYTLKNKIYAVGVQTLPATDITNTGFTANWTAADACYGYALTYGTKLDANGQVCAETIYVDEWHEVPNSSDRKGISYKDHTSYKLTGLERDKKYYYSVRAYDAHQIDTTAEECYGTWYDIDRDDSVYYYTLPSDPMTATPGFDLTVTTDIKGATVNLPTAEPDKDYVDTISVSDKYILPKTIKVTVGGEELPDRNHYYYGYTYDSKTGKITVPGYNLKERTDNIFITAGTYHDKLTPVTK